MSHLRHRIFAGFATQRQSQFPVFDSALCHVLVSHEGAQGTPPSTKTYSLGGKSRKYVPLSDIGLAWAQIQGVPDNHFHLKENLQSFPTHLAYFHNMCTAATPAAPAPPGDTPVRGI